MTINMPRGPRCLELGSILMLFLVIQISANETELAATSADCYYNYNHYSEGDRILTNEPCLNCTCHNKMLMCYLKVCPFTKPIGQDCTIEKREDQCCPIITCPEVPVELDQSVMQSSTDLATHQPYGCSIDGRFYAEGAQIPGNPKKPCELCYCIRNMTSCVMQECTLHVDGCRPIYNKGVCCPVRYDCAHEDEIPMLEDSQTTTEAPSQGFIITTTSASAQSTECIHDGVRYIDGELIDTEQACEHCYCMRGDIVCAVQDCGKPLEMHSKNCTARLPKEGECCPQVYECESDEPAGTTIINLGDESATTLGYKEIPEIHADEEITTVGSIVMPASTEHIEKAVTEADEAITTERIDESENEIHDKDYDHITVKPSRTNTSQYAPETVDNRIESEESTTFINKLDEPAATTILSDLGASDEHLTTLLPVQEKITEKPSEELQPEAEKSTESEGILSNLYTTIKSIVDFTTTLSPILDSDREDDGALLSNVIPGEGDCLESGISYSNSSLVPTRSKCETSCICLNSIVQCEQTKCPPMPPNAQNCRIVQDIDSCCPSYHCESMEMSTDVAPPQQAESQTIHRDTPIVASTIASELEATTQTLEEEKIAESTTLAREEPISPVSLDEVEKVKPEIVTEIATESELSQITEMQTESPQITEKQTELPTKDILTTEKAEKEASTESNVVEQATEQKIIPTEQPIVTEKVEPEATTVFLKEKEQIATTEKAEIVTESFMDEETYDDYIHATHFGVPAVHLDEIPEKGAELHQTTYIPLIDDGEESVATTLIPLPERIGEEEQKPSEPEKVHEPKKEIETTEQPIEVESTTLHKIADEPSLDVVTQAEIVPEEQTTESDKKDIETIATTEVPKLDDELSATEKSEIDEPTYTTQKQIELATVEPEQQQLATKKPELEKTEIQTEKVPLKPIVDEDLSTELPALEQVTTEKELDTKVESTESNLIKQDEPIEPISTEKQPLIDALNEIPTTEQQQEPIVSSEISSTEKQEIEVEKLTETMPDTSENVIQDSSTDAHIIHQDEIVTEKQGAVEQETEKQAAQTELPIVQDVTTSAAVLEPEQITDKEIKPVVLEEEQIATTTYRLPVEEEHQKVTQKPLETVEELPATTEAQSILAEKEIVTTEKLPEILEASTKPALIELLPGEQEKPSIEEQKPEIETEKISEITTQASVGLPSGISHDEQKPAIEEQKPEIETQKPSEEQKPEIETQKPSEIEKEIEQPATTESQPDLVEASPTTIRQEAIELSTESDALTPAPVTVARDESITESYDQKMPEVSSSSETITESQTEKVIEKQEPEKIEMEQAEITTVPSSKVEFGGIDSTQFKEGDVISPSDKEESAAEEKPESVTEAKVEQITTQKSEPAVPSVESVETTTNVIAQTEKAEKSTESPIVQLHEEEPALTTSQPIALEKEPIIPVESVTESKAAEMTTVYSIPSKQEDLEIITESVVPSKQEDLDIEAHTEQHVEMEISSEQPTTLASKIDIEQPAEEVTVAKEEQETPTTQISSSESSTPSKESISEDEALTPTTEQSIPFIKEEEAESKLPTSSSIYADSEQTTLGAILEKSTEHIESATDAKVEEEDLSITTSLPAKLDDIPSMHDEIKPELVDEEVITTESAIKESPVTTESAIQEEIATTVKYIEPIDSSVNRIGEEQAQSTTVKLAEYSEAATTESGVQQGETTLKPVSIESITSLPTEPSVIDITTLLNKIHDESVSIVSETTLGSILEEVTTQQAEIKPEISSEKEELPEITEKQPEQSHDVQPEPITEVAEKDVQLTTVAAIEKGEEIEHSTALDETQSLTTEPSIVPIVDKEHEIPAISEEKPVGIDELIKLPEESTTLPSIKVESDNQLQDEQTTISAASEQTPESDESTKIAEISTEKDIPMAPYDAHQVPDIAFDEQRTTIAPIVSESTPQSLDEQKPVDLEPISHIESTEAAHIEPEAISTTVKSELEQEVTTKLPEIESIEVQTTESAPAQPEKEFSSSQDSDIATFSPEPVSRDEFEPVVTTEEPVKQTDAPIISHDELPVESSEIPSEQSPTTISSLLDGTTIKTVVDLFTTLHPIEQIVQQAAETTTVQSIDAITTEKSYESENVSMPIEEAAAPGIQMPTEQIPIVYSENKTAESYTSPPLIRDPLPDRFDEITTKLAESFDTTTLPSSLLSSHTEQISDSTTIKNTQNEITESAQHTSQDSSSLPAEQHAAQPADEHEQPETQQQHHTPSQTYPSQYDPSGGYGNVPSQYPDEEYTDEEEPAVFGPGTCRYGGKLYVSAQQIPRDDPCDFCFCFRSDIICLQQSCPPPISGCHEEPISGFCCPRYECPVSYGIVSNATTTTTTTLPPYLSHFQRNANNKVTRSGCNVQGVTYKIGDRITAASGPCIDCICGGDGQMKCDPKVCTPEPMLRQMIAVAASRR